MLLFERQVASWKTATQKYRVSISGGINGGVAYELAMSNQLAVRYEATWQPAIAEAIEEILLLALLH